CSSDLVVVAVAVAVGVAVAVAVAVVVAVAVAVGVDVAVAVAVGVGLGQPPLVTLISTDVVVLLPVYPPTTTAVLPTSVPAGNERSSLIEGPLLQLSLTGSYTCRMFVVSGTPTPFFPALGIAIEPRKGLPPPKT